VDTVYKADNFDFELACTEVCGRGHFSMRKKVVVLDKTEYDAWYAEKKKATILSQMGAPATTSSEPKLSSAAKPGEILDNN
jgi:cytochrome c oxidase subunit II